MINTLPLLSSDWKEWEWDKSNGNAAADHTLVAHFLLLYQGLCSDFSRHVWNDIVDMTANALSAAGIEWDETYGTAEECKITESLGALTASAFNGVAQNIHQFGFVSWRWAEKRGLPGYTGRNAFRGYSQYGDNADFIYGWHIIELVEKLNLMLSVLKNEADFSEFEKVLQGMSYSNTNVVSAKASALDCDNTANSILSVSLARARVLEQSASVDGWSYHKGILVKNKPEIITSVSSTYSASDAFAETIKAQAVQSNVGAQTYVNAVLKDLIFVGYLRYSKPILSKVLAELEASNLCDLSTISTALGKSSANLILAGTWILEVLQYGKTYESADLLKVAPVQLKALNYADSFSISDITLKDRAILKSIERSKTAQSSILGYQVARYMKSSRYSLSYFKTTMNTMIPKKMQSDIIVNGYSESAVNGCPVFLLDWKEKAESLTDSVVNAVQISKLETNATEISISGTEIRISDVKRLTVHEQAVSNAHGIIQIELPVVLESKSREATTTIGNINALPEKRMHFCEHIQSRYRTEIINQSASLLETVCRTNTASIALLELEYNSQNAWKEPIRNGNDLYIRSVYPQWQEGSNVHIDSSGIFYEPLQTGNNVYIRSNESIKGV